jgi:carboxypeptidase family protein
MVFVRTATTLILAFVVTVTCVGTTRPETAMLPAYDRQAITSGFTAALVGIVVDSASGSPIEHAQILLRSVMTSQPHYVFTDPRGGFVLGRMEPGRYSVLVRSLGYAFRADSLSMTAGTVHTLSTRLRRVSTCQGIDCQ